VGRIACQRSQVLPGRGQVSLGLRETRLGRRRGALGGFLERLGIDVVFTWKAVVIAMAVTGRSDARQDPPYISWAVRFGKLEGPALTSPAPSSLAMAVMTVDPNQGANWIDKSIAGKAVLVGHPGMVRQDDHHRGLPVVHVGRTAIYAVIAEDDAWIEEVIAGLPA